MDLILNKITSKPEKIELAMDLMKELKDKIPEKTTPKKVKIKAPILEILNQILKAIKSGKTHHLPKMNQSIESQAQKWIKSWAQLKSHGTETHIEIPDDTIIKKNNNTYSITGDFQLHHSQKNGQLPAQFNQDPIDGTDTFKITLDPSNKQIIAYQENIWGEHWR